MQIIPAKNTNVPDPEYEVLRCSDDLFDDVFDHDKTLTPSSVRPVPSAAKKPRIVSKEDIFLSTDDEETTPSLEIRPPAFLLTRVFLREMDKIPSPCLLQIIAIVRTTAANEVGKFGMNVVIQF